MEGVLGDTGTVDGDAAYIGDDSGIRDGGDGVACGHGSSGPNMEGLRKRFRRMGFGSSFCLCCELVFVSCFGFGLVMIMDLGASKAEVESEAVVAAVSTLAVENSLSLSDEDEILDELRPESLGSRFLALCADDVVVVVICDGAKIG